jgi:signal transduction histidine kinase
MPNMKRLLSNRWMLTPVEIIAIAVVIALTVGGIFFSVQDALQLGRALNLNLTQTIILNQGIVNLQRDVQLTHREVTRLLGGLDDPPGSITRFAFVKIQVSNLANQVGSATRTYDFAEDDLALIQEIVDQSAAFEQLLTTLEQENSASQKTAILQTMDAELASMENTIKQLVDRQATVQREEIVQTRDSLATAQRTSLLAGVVLLLMGVALAAVVRRGLSLRLEQALEADRLKSQLLNSVSHELRTPLAAIKGYSQLLGEDAYGTLSAGQKTTVQRILINTTQLQGMVNNLLDHAQIEQGKLVLRNEKFAANDLINTTHSALNILAVTKGVALTSEIAHDVPVTLTGDLLRLQQILVNLTSNALKFTESGTVHLSIFLPDPAHWAMRVADTGIGISNEDQSRVFAPFWQIDSSATRQYRGSGLGLAIVKELADLMDGRISLTSQPGKGSTFTVIFPIEVKSDR